MKAKDKPHKTRRKKFCGLPSEINLFRKMVESRKAQKLDQGSPGIPKPFCLSRSPVDPKNPYPRSDKELKKLIAPDGDCGLKTERSSDSDSPGTPLSLRRFMAQNPLVISTRDEPSYYRPPRQRLKSLMQQPEFYYNPAQAAAKLPPHKLPKILLTKEFQKTLKKKKRGRPRKYARPEDLAHPERLDLMASPPRDESAFIFLRKLRREHPNHAAFRKQPKSPTLSRKAEYDAVHILMGLRANAAKYDAATTPEPRIKTEPGMGPPGSPGYRYSFDSAPPYGADRSSKTRSGSASPQYSPYEKPIPRLERASANPGMKEWADASSEPAVRDSEQSNKENVKPPTNTQSVWKPGLR